MMAVLQAVNGREPADGPIVVCIARDPAERAQLAGRFARAGVLVLAADRRSAIEALAGLPRMHRVAAADEVRLGALVVDVDRFAASWRGRPLPLSRHEFGVLACLVRRPGQLWTFEQLHEHAWGGTYFTGPSAVQSAVKRLRAKLRDAGVTHRLNSNRGLGFRLDPSEPA